MPPFETKLYPCGRKRLHGGLMSHLNGPKMPFFLSPENSRGGPSQYPFDRNDNDQVFIHLS